MNNKVDYENGKIFPMILQFSIPAALSLLISAVYNIVDRMFVGNCNGSVALAALSICFPLSFMMIAFGLMCSAGGSTLFTLFRGAGEQKHADAAFGSAFFFTVVFELCLMVFLQLLSDPLLRLFGVTETTYDMALAYYRIVSLGCVFQGLSFVFCDFTRVSGKPVLGMFVTGVGAVTNIVLDAVFVAVLGWGVEGAAWATVIGQVASVLFGGFLIFSGKTMVRTGKDALRPDFAIGKRILDCGFAFWISQIAMGFIALVYNGQLGKYGGDVAISVYAVISSVMTFVIMPASGISQGIQPILGFNYGSGHGERVKKVMIQATALSVGVTVVIWAIAQMAPGTIIRMFGGEEELLQIGVPALRANFILAPVLGFVMLATTFFQSIGKPRASSMITLVRQVAALIPFIYILPTVFGTMGIFYAQPISDVIATIISAVLVAKEFRGLSGK